MSVYFARPIDGGPIKIGYSDDVPTRIGQLETHYGRSLELLATMPGGREEEAEVHARFARLRIGRTEQFRPDPELMAYIGQTAIIVDANPDSVEVMEPTTVVIVHLKGTPQYAAFLDAIHKKTHIPKTIIMRLALALWSKQNGHGEPPEQ